jgi:hypothetical protein
MGAHAGGAPASIGAAAGRRHPAGRQLQRQGAGALPWWLVAEQVVEKGAEGAALGIGAAGAAALAGVAAFLWPSSTVSGAEEQRMLEEAQAATALRIGDQIRSNTTMLAIHLARILGSEVAGMPPDHQDEPPERNRPHWWKEVLNFIKEISKHGLSPKQLGRELAKKFTKEQIEAIIAAIKKAADLLGQDPPDFPPIAFP